MQKNIKFIVDALFDNDDFVNFVFETTNARLKSLFYKRTLKQNNNHKTISTTNNDKCVISPFSVFPQFLINLNISLET